MKFCSIAPPYPQRAYLVTVFLKADELIQIFTLYLLSVSPKYLIDDMQELIQYIEKERSADNSAEVLESCIVIPATFSSRFELKKEYWANPTLPYSSEQRQQAFLPVIARPQLYQLLVLPNYYDKKTKQWQFAAALPLPANPSHDLIERFMLTSDAIVDQSAQYAALYDLSAAIRFNWKTKTAEPMFEGLQKGTEEEDTKN